MSSPSKAYRKLQGLRDEAAALCGNFLLYTSLDAHVLLETARLCREQFNGYSRLTVEEMQGLTQDEAISLGFYRHTTHLGWYGLPSWMWWAIPAKGALETLEGKQREYDFEKNPPSSDTRGGFLAYGLRFSAKGAILI